MNVDNEMNISELESLLLARKDHIANKLSLEEKKEAYNLAEKYKSFLNGCKTERETVSYIIAEAEKHGFCRFDLHHDYVAGDKIYYLNRNKSIILSIIGKKPIQDGMRMAVAHVDSPHLDLKPSPLYESNNLALFKTRYYGGIKKYQWPTLPLALHGVIVNQNGNTIDIIIGEQENEPKFVISDLLPHLSREQFKKTLDEGISGEDLNILVGSTPLFEGCGENVKLHVLKILYEKYGVVEQDFVASELEAVPAFKASDVGFDGGLIGGYGQDDRSCVFASISSLFKIEKAPEKTIVLILTDKEETGSDGNTGIKSTYLKRFVSLLSKQENVTYQDVLSASCCISADTCPAFDPSFSTPYDIRNSAFINRGVVVAKYLGGKGKSSTSDASAEFVGYITQLLDAYSISWQTGEFGAVDAGRGGTVARHIAALDVDVIDLCLPLLSMHSPYELISKYDLFMMKKAIEAFYNSH